MKDFTPVAFVGVAPLILVVHPSVPAKSVKELIALAKSRPGKLNGTFLVEETALWTRVVKDSGARVD